MTVTVGRLFDENKIRLELRLVGDAVGLEREITRPDLERPGLVLAGHFQYQLEERVHILGKSETDFLANLDSAERRRILGYLARECRTPCFFISRGLEPPRELSEICREQRVPILLTPKPTPEVISAVSFYLQDVLAQSVEMHGVLLDIKGVGLLILGKAGIGKSECALELVSRGHRLVADDVVRIKCKFNSVLVGNAPERIREYMEIRGIGIINVRHLFGVNAVRDQKRVELVVQIREWRGRDNYERVGLETQYKDILGIKIPQVVIPASPGKNIASIVELAAMNYLVRRRGFNPARELNRSLIERMQGDAAALEVHDKPERPYVDLTDDLRDTE
ncbi:MAG: HPr(Ser) kinase/phosphatase [Candidatus Coatesbacteria bacterium]|nr:HPr(Ser) kinase/phosphatase [Candidatus Coatesbacteria bacterium]